MIAVSNACGKLSAAPVPEPTLINFSTPQDFNASAPIDSFKRTGSEEIRPYDFIDFTRRRNAKAALYFEAAATSHFERCAKHERTRKATFVFKPTL